MFLTDKQASFVCFCVYTACFHLNKLILDTRIINFPHSEGSGGEKGGFASAVYGNMMIIIILESDYFPQYTSRSTCTKSKFTVYLA